MLLKVFHLFLHIPTYYGPHLSCSYASDSVYLVFGLYLKVEVDLWQIYWFQCFLFISQLGCYWNNLSFINFPTVPCTCVCQSIPFHFISYPDTEQNSCSSLRFGFLYTNLMSVVFYLISQWIAQNNWYAVGCWWLVGWFLHHQQPPNNILCRDCLLNFYPIRDTWL